jgi:hypothetical protein
MKFINNMYDAKKVDADVLLVFIKCPLQISAGIWANLTGFFVALQTL